MSAKFYLFSVEIIETVINLTDNFFIKKVGSSFYRLLVKKILDGHHMIPHGLPECALPCCGNCTDA